MTTNKHNLNIKLNKILDEGYINKHYQKQNNMCSSLMVLEALKIKGDTYGYGFKSLFLSFIYYYYYF